MPDDYAANTNTSGSVFAGGWATGEIEQVYDQDWFAVTLEAGITYRIDLEGAITGRGTNYDPHLQGIYNSSGRLLNGTTNADGGLGLNSRVFFTPDADGTYYIAAAGQVPGSAVGGGRTYHTAGATGTYRVSVTQVRSPDDYSADTSTAGTVSVGRSATGEINSSGDRDWFAVTLEAGTTYRIDLEGSPTGRGTLSDSYLRGIYDSGGNRLDGTTDDDDGVGRNSRVWFTPDDDGTYYIAAGAYGSGLGTYRVSVNQVRSPDDYSADTNTAGAVAPRNPVTGEIESSGDRDWFAVTLEAGTAYRIELEGSSTGRGTLSDPYLRGIYDSDGNPLGGTTDDDDGVGRNSRVLFTPESDGTYYVAAGAYGSEMGTYRVSVTPVGNPDDYSANTGTAGAVAVGGSATGEIGSSGDRDWFAVTLEAGATYRIDLEGLVTNRGTVSDPYLHGIYDSSSNRLSGTTDDDGGIGRNSRILFTPDDDGTYYVAAGALGSELGTYRVSVTQVGSADDYSANTGTAGAVAVGGSATGEIESSGDRDWFAVTLEAGTRYRFDLEGSPTGRGTLSDAYLRGIYDTDSNRQGGTTNDDGGSGRNSRVWFTPESDGTYYVSAGAYSSNAGTYEISVEEVI